MNHKNYYKAVIFLIYFFLVGKSLGQRIEITLFHGFVDPSIQNEFTQIIQEYNINHPNYFIKPILYGTEDQLSQKIHLWIESGHLPDILIWSSPYAASLFCKTQLVRVDDFWNTELNSLPILPEIRKSHQIQSHYFAIPLTSNVLGLVVNKKKFQENNIPIPRTWNEWIDCIEHFNKKNIYPIYIPDQNIEWTVWFWEVLYWQSGGNFQFEKDFIIHIDSIAFNRSFSFFKFLYQKSHALDSLYDYHQYNFFQKFLSGETPMVIMGNWVKKELIHANLLEDIEIIPIPAPDRNTICGNIGGESAIILTNDSVKIKVIYDFFRYFYRNNKIQQFNHSIGNFPPYSNSSRNDNRDPFINQFMKIYLKGKTRPTIPYYAEFSTYIGFYLNLYLKNKILLHDIYNEINKKIRVEAQKLKKSCFKN